MNTPKILLEKYKSYSRDEQRILRLISVIDQPKNISEVRQVLRKLNWQTHDGILLSEMLNTKLRVRWVSDGIVIVKLNKMYCNSNIAELITRETIKDHSFADILSVVESLFPVLEHKGIGYSEQGEFTWKRKIRKAFYLNDEVTLLQHLDISESTDLYTLDNNKIRYLIQLCTTPFDSEFFE